MLYSSALTPNSQGVIPIQQPNWGAWGNSSVFATPPVGGDYWAQQPTSQQPVGMSQMGGPAMPGGPQNSGFGLNLGTFNAGLSGLQTLSGLFMGMKQLGLAKADQRIKMAFANRNLENQTKTMNMALEDRTANRSAMYAGTSDAMSPAQAQAYMDKNRFNTAPITKRG